MKQAANLTSLPPSEHGEKQQEGVRFLTFDRPAQKNALTLEVAKEFQAHLAALREDPKARVLVLGANGDWCSAGGDFDFLQERHEDTPPNNRNKMKNVLVVSIHQRWLHA